KMPQLGIIHNHRSKHTNLTSNIMVRAYLDLHDTWDADKNEYKVSVYLTTQSETREISPPKNQFSNRFSHNFVIRKPRRESSNTEQLDDHSENLLRSIYVRGQTFIPTPVVRHIPYIKNIGRSLFEALCPPESIVANLFDEFPDPMDLS